MSDEGPAIGDVWVARDPREEFRKLRVLTVEEDKVLARTRGRKIWFPPDRFVRRFRLERRRRDAIETQRP